MMSPNDAAPRTRSAMPGALGSSEITSMFGEPKREIDQHHAGGAGERAGERDRGQRRADVARAADHGDRAAAVAGLAQALPRSSSIVGAATAGWRATAAAPRLPARRRWRRRHIGGRRQAIAGAGAGVGERAGAAGDRSRRGVDLQRRRAIGFAAQQRARHHERGRRDENVPSAAISTIGIFFGKYGTFDTTAREMMRASAGAAAMLSRAVASRYLAR